MGDVEQRLVDLLMEVEYIEDVETLLRGSLRFDVNSFAETASFDGSWLYAPHCDLQELIVALSLRARHYDSIGLTAHAALARFFIPIVEARRENIRSDRLSDSVKIGKTWETVLAASRVSGLLSKIRFLRTHLGELDTQTSLEMDHLVRNLPLQDIELILAWGLATDPKHHLIARARWIAYCRSRRNYRHAEKHLSQLEQLIEASGPYVSLNCHIYDQLGNDLLAIGDSEGAIEAYTRGLQMPVELEIIAPAIAGIGLKLARLLSKLGRTRDALHVISGIDFLPTRAGVYSQQQSMWALRANLLILRAHLLEELRRYDEGRRFYSLAVDAAQQSGDRQLQFSVRASIAASYARAGRSRDGVHAAQQALDFARSLGDARLTQAALNNLGLALRYSGDIVSAEACYERSFNVFEGPGSGRGTALFALGDIARERGDYKTAFAMYDRGFEIAEHPYELNYASMTVIDSLAKMLPDSTEMLARLIESAPDSLQSDWEFYRVIVHARIQISLAMGRREEAIQDCRLLVEEAMRHGPDSLSALDENMRLVRLLRKDGSSHSIQEAFDILWRLRGRLDQAIAGMAGTAQVATTLNEHRPVYDVLIDLLLTGPPSIRLPDSRPRIELAFDLHEEAKARVLLKVLSDAPLAAPHSVPKDLLAREAALLEERRSLSHSRTGLRPDRESQRLARLEGVQEALAEVWRLMKPYDPGYVQLREGGVTRFARLRNVLRRQPTASNSALVSVFCGSKETTIFTYIPQRDELAATRIPLDHDQLAKVAQQLRYAFNGNSRAFPPTTPIRSRQPWKRSVSFFEDTASQLLSFLPAVHDCELLCIAPDGPAHALPFHALPVPGGTGVLAQRAAVIYAPSLSVLLHTIARRHARTSPGLPLTALFACVAAHEDRNSEFLESDNSLALADWKVTSISGIQVTPQSILEQLGRHRLVHLACHGYFDDANPLDSGLLLSDGHSRPSRSASRTPIRARVNHLLTIQDVAKTSMQVDLMTLRACSAGLREEDLGNSLGSLAEAMLYAGADLIVAPLWNVDQQSSKEFISSFYRNYDRDRPEPRWRSFWRAQKSMIENPHHEWESHLYHWAALCLVGGWE